MHLLLDLGQLCAAKPRGGQPPAHLITQQPSGKPEARVSCVAVHQKKKISVVLRMEPLVLRSFEAVHGRVNPGDALDINICQPPEVETYKREFSGDGWYFLITTDTLSRAPTLAEAKEQKDALAVIDTAHSAMN